MTRSLGKRRVTQGPFHLLIIPWVFLSTRLKVLKLSEYRALEPKKFLLPNDNMLVTAKSPIQARDTNQASSV